MLDNLEKNLEMDRMFVNGWDTVVVKAGDTYIITHDGESDVMIEGDDYDLCMEAYIDTMNMWQISRMAFSKINDKQAEKISLN